MNTGGKHAESAARTSAQSHGDQPILIKRVGVAALATLALFTLTLTLTLLAACAPDDAEVQASIEAEPAAPAMAPADEVSALGTEVWREAAGDPNAGSYTVGHTGSTFLLTTLGDERMDTLTGTITTGTVAGRFALPQGSSWPLITGAESDPRIVAAVPASPGGPVAALTAWDADGTVVWQRDAADLGLAAGTQLRVEAADAGRVVVRTADGAVSPYQDAELWLLDAATGATIWDTPGGATVRWAQADNGLLMYTWRSDGVDDQPSDRVTVRALADGAELSTTTVTNDYGGGTRLNTQCGGIASPDRVVICRWEGPDRATILAATDGTTIGEWPASELPLIDPDAGVATLTVPGDDGGLLGIGAADGTELWRYSPAEATDYDITLDQATQGVLLGSTGKRNLAMASRTGEWLARIEFDYLRDGAAVGNYAVVFRDGDAIGVTAPGVAIATLQDADDSVLFVRP